MKGFADDLVIISKKWNEEHISTMINKIASTAKKYGLELNKKKCGIM